MDNILQLRRLAQLNEYDESLIVAADDDAAAALPL
jgi:hypothetical protein